MLARAADDSACGFGRWLATLPPNKAQASIQERVTTLHATFHLEAADALSLLRAGRTREAEQALASDGPLAQTSSALIRLMKEWLDSLPKEPPNPQL